MGRLAEDRPPCPGEGWERNPGHQPEHTKAKRVAVVLRNGQQPSIEPVVTTGPSGWAADKCRWSISRPAFGFDIEWFRVL